MTIISVLMVVIILVLVLFLRKYYLQFNKFKTLFRTLNLWMMVINHGLSIADYFKKKNYNNVAIYGLGEIGERLEEYLREENINVMYGIDSKVKLVNSRMPVIKPDEIKKMDKPDVIIITANLNKKQTNIELAFARDIPTVTLEEITRSFVYGEYSKRGNV